MTTETDEKTPRRVLITGGTGSLGRALVRRFLAAGSTVCTYARCEVRRAELIAEYPAVHAYLGDVRDQQRLEDCLGGVDTVIHAAALKRVDAGDEHPSEMVKTNVLGTQNVIDACVASGVRRLLLISSDKACCPTNIYGSTKLDAEHFVIASNSKTIPKTGLRCSAVRYGNVLGSRGSVVHTWRAQLAAGRPLVITDPDMTRFWLTLDQACDLVFDALALMRGGELIVPALPAMRLLDVAAALAPGHPHQFAGIRPGGEKLAERLLSDEEVRRAMWSGSRIIVAPSHHSWTAEEWTGAPLPAGFQYQSDCAPFGWLSVDEMRSWLKEV